jgi:hypothetical protein
MVMIRITIFLLSQLSGIMVKYVTVSLSGLSRISCFSKLSVVFSLLEFIPLVIMFNLGVFLRSSL